METDMRPPRVRRAVVRHPYTAGWVGLWLAIFAVFFLKGVLL